jgi:hypothetical protein
LRTSPASVVWRKTANGLQPLYRDSKALSDRLKIVVSPVRIRLRHFANCW